MDDSDNETVIVDDSNEKYWTSGNELSYLKMQMDEIRGRLSVVETRKSTFQLVAKSVEQQHDKFVKEQFVAVKEQLEQGLEKHIEKHLEKPFGTTAIKKQVDQETRDLKGKKEPVLVSSRRKRTRI